MVARISGTDPGPSPPLQHGTAVFVGRHAVAQLFMWSGLYYLFPALTAAILADTGWTARNLTAAFTAGFLLWALASPLVGRAIDRGHGARVMRAGAVSGAVLLVAMSQAPSFGVFAPLMVVLGISMAATLYDPCFSVMMRRLGERGGRAVGDVTLVAGFATLLTFPLVGWLVPGLGWRGAVISAAGLLLVAAVLIPSEDGRAPLDSPTEDAPHRRLSLPVVLIGAAFATTMFSHAALLFALPVQLLRVPETAGVALLLPALLGPAQICGRLVCLALLQRVDPVPAATGLFVVLLLPPLLFLLVPYRVGAVLPVLLLQGACYGMHTILRPVLARRFVPAFRLGRDLGLIAMIGLVLMATGPAVGGAVWDWAGFRVLAGILLAVNAAGVLLLACLPRREPA